ncbi:hypothetical protein VIGAN_11181000, partial [Vigna angularis var. angularis]
MKNTKSLRYKSEIFSNLGQPSVMSNLSTDCISQYVEGHSPRFLNSGALNHISVRKEVKNVTIKATYKEDMIRFKITLNRGIVELKEEIAKRLKLEEETFDIKY